MFKMFKMFKKMFKEVGLVVIVKNSSSQPTLGPLLANCGWTVS